MTDEFIAAVIAWLAANNFELLLELFGDVAPPDPEREPEPERSPEETLAYWRRPGRTAAVDAQWACLVGSYYHTCTLWINGAGDRVSCALPGCDPTG